MEKSVACEVIQIKFIKLLSIFELENYQEIGNWTLSRNYNKLHFKINCIKIFVMVS